MELFFRTLFDGIKEGTIAAWYDTRWYICIMAIVLVVYLAIKALKKLFNMPQGQETCILVEEGRCKR